MLVTRSSFADDLAPFKGARRLIVDTETTGLPVWHGHRICGVSVSTVDLRHIRYFPVRHKRGANITRSQYRELLQVLADTPVLTGWNIKFDLEFFIKDGFPVPEQGDQVEDVMLAAHHLSENDQPFELKRWAAKYIDPSAADAEDELIETIKRYGKEFGFKVYKRKEKAHISELRPEDAAIYACDDVYWTERLRKLCVRELKKWHPNPQEPLANGEMKGPYQLWRESNEYLLDTMQMEMRGFQMDVGAVKRNVAKANREAKKAYKVIVEKAGYEINLRSPKQLCAWLKTTSSAQAVLEQMGTPEAEAIVTYRAWTGAVSRYYMPLLEQRDELDILHPSLKLHGTVTGRQSSYMHTMPKEKKYGYEGVKECLVARPGMVLVSADYNQMELRMGVSVAQEENMAKLFLSGDKVDIHQAVADALGIGRDAAKTINFMILYGGGAEKLATKLQIPLSRAREYLEAYHKEYWHFRHTSRFWANRAHYQKYIRLWSGRVRHFNHPRANPKDAFNSKVQGGSAEVLRYSIRRITPELPRWDAYMLLQIHDQIIVETPEQNTAPVAALMREHMENFHQFLIRPVVDIKIGPRWSGLVDYAPTLRRVA